MKRATLSNQLSFLFLFVGIVAGSLDALHARELPVDRQLGPPFKQRLRASLGPAEASLVFIEVSDFRCDHCRLFHENVFPKIKQRFVDTGLMRYIALPTIPPKGDPAPELFGVARFALEAGRFWDLRGDLFAASNEHGAENIAKRIGLDPAAASAYVRSPAAKEAVAADEAEAAALGVVGTPTFILRKRQRDGTFVEAVVDGSDTWEYMNRFITEMLERKED